MDAVRTSSRGGAEFFTGSPATSFGRFVSGNRPGDHVGLDV